MMSGSTYQFSLLTFEEFADNYIQSGARWYNHPEYYGSLATSTPDLHPYYIAAYRGDTLVAIMYMQVVDFPLSSLLRRLKSENRISKFLLTMFLYIFSKFKWRIASYGNLYFIPDTGCLFDKNINRQEKEEIVAAIHSYVQKNAKFRHIKAFMFSNITEEKKHNVPQGFSIFEVDPVMVLRIKENWNSFQDYIEALSSKYRIRLKKVLQVSKPITDSDMSLQEISEYEQQLYTLYNAVARHAEFNISYLGESYFSMIKKVMPDKFFIHGYYLQGNLVGFVSYFCDEAQIHIHYMGMDYTVQSEYKLYNRMLTDFVRIAIDKKMTSLDFGRTATEIKSTLGAVPLRIFTFITFSSSLLNKFLPRIIKNFEAQPYTLRSPFRSADE